MTTTDSQQVRLAITASVAVHVLLLLLLAWIMATDASARRLLAEHVKVKERPKVTMLYPQQVLPSPKLRPKLDRQQYIRTSQNEPAPDKPVKSDFISDHNTKAAAEKAAAPDGDKPMPTSKGVAQPTLELVDRENHAGELADDEASKAVAATPPPVPAVPPTPSAPDKTSLSPLLPQEPPTVPKIKAKEVAKADASAVAKMIEDVDRDAGRLDTTQLPLQVKKAEAAPPASSSAQEPPPSPTVAVTPPPAVPPLAAEPVKPKRALENFSPLTRKATVKGTISDKGDAAVNAEATPKGNFMHLVTGAVERKWHEFRRTRGDAVTYGYLKVRFYVNRVGNVEDLEFVEKSGNPLMDSFTLDAILAAHMPPIPDTLLPELEDGRFLVEYDIIIHD